VVPPTDRHTAPRVTYGLVGGLDDAVHGLSVYHLGRPRTVVRASLGHRTSHQRAGVIPKAAKVPSPYGQKGFC
jgi:hypothetical protein